jgi:ribosomal protein S12 methylthiotransferase
VIQVQNLRKGSPNAASRTPAETVEPGRSRTFAIVTLGCTKNVVDSEGIQQTLIAHGHVSVDEPAAADTVIVNTCGFIGPSKQESIDAILRLAADKRPDQTLIASGCLIERYAAELAQEIPEIDALVGVHRWPEMPQLLDAVRERAGAGGARVARSAIERLDGDPRLPPIYIGDGVSPRSDLMMPGRATSAPSAYLKVSDGCDASCTFCAIPSMKGQMRSKDADLIIQEARELAACGVKEIVLVGQDTTAYYRDRGDLKGLPKLLRRLAEEVPDLPWIRIMYAYPQHVSDALLDAMAELPQVCRYLDVPLQHAHPETLRRMRRPHGAVEDLVARIRDRVPGVALRTTFIVGFPGETEEEYAELYAAVERMRFDRVGVFAYSREEGTPAYDLPDQVPDVRKDRRRRELMLLARRISRENNASIVGQELEVLAEGTAKGRDGVIRTVARSYRDAPEVDGLVMIDGEVAVGAMHRVRITGASEYDLNAVPLA